MEAIARAVPGRSSAPARCAARRRAGGEGRGCTFAVSPGYTPAIGQACRAIGLPLLPGTATGSEVMQANADGYFFLKFFPAMQAGGIAMLKALGGPFTDVVFCPTGGITLATRAGVPGAAEREGLRRLVADARRCGRGAGLGARSRARPRGQRDCALSSPVRRLDHHRRRAAAGSCSTSTAATGRRARPRTGRVVGEQQRARQAAP
jgi:hypothetical protein